MSPARRRRLPYWTLFAFAALLALPLSWGLAAMAVAGAGVVAASAVRRVAAQRAATRSPGEGEVVLGVDRRGRPVALSDGQLAAHGLIVGASGAGKSTTLLGILTDQIHRGRSVVAIDLKGSPAFATQLRRTTELAGREFRLWTPDGPEHWNPLAHGNATSLKDKLIATERFTEPHYQRAAERYVQSAVGVLLAARPGAAPQLEEVVSLMEPRRLASMLRHVDRPLADRVQDYLAGLTPDQVSAIRGLGTRLAILSESHAGPYLAPSRDPGRSTIDLRRTLDGEDVVLFSLNSSVYGKLAGQLGTLVIQDLVSNAGHRLGASGDGQRAPVPAVIGIDEFSALGADNVLALLARGREAGAAVLLCTQELADLDRAGPGFRDQVLGNTSLKLAHRQDVPSSAHTIAQMIGTEQVWQETRQLQSPFGRSPASRGTRRQVEQFIVHPNEIKTLQTGEAVMLTKTPIARATRLRVLPPRQASARGPSARGQAGDAGQRGQAGNAGQRGQAGDAGQRGHAGNAGRRGRAGGADQPDPGVTR